jgi:uroporphyrinogen-III decarboxylase
VDRASLDLRTERHPVDADWAEDVATIGTPKGPITEASRVSLKGEPGFQTRHAIQDTDDLERFLSLPVTTQTPPIDGYLEAVKTVGDRALVIADIGSNPIGMAHNLLGSETLAIWAITERDALRTLLAALTKRWTAHVERLLDAGITGVFGTLGHEVALPPLLAPADFREFVGDNDRPVMDMIRDRGNLIHVHSHYNLRRALDSFVALRINCLHPVEAPPMGDIELAEAKRRLAGKVCIEGNMQIGEMQTATPDEIRRTTRKIIEDAAAGGGLILCPTASPHWPTLSARTLANYVAFIETGREYGRY